VAVIEYHTGDVYDNPASLARLSYYGLGGTPTAWFDGGSPYVGGNHTTSMYSNYLPKYNERIAIPSSFTLDVHGVVAGPNAFEIAVTVEKVATFSEAVVLHVVVIESDIAQSWQGLSVLNHVARLMVPNQIGTPLDFSSGDVLTKVLFLDLDPSWVISNSQVIVFVQDPSSKEVQQGTIHDLSGFPSYAVEASVRKVYAPKSVCEDAIVPKVMIANNGTENLTSLEIVYDVNGESQMSFNWSGNLGSYETETVLLDEITFTPQAQNSLNIAGNNPNGQTDEFIYNNERAFVMEEAANVSSPVSLALKLDDNPEETSWELLDGEGTVLYSGGGYTTAGQFIIEQFDLNDNDCYMFKIYDEGGDGLTGAASFKLAYDGSNIFAEGKAFGFEDQLQFGIGLTGIDDVALQGDFRIYPNPMRDLATVSFSLDRPETISLTVYNALGEIIHQIKTTAYAPGNHNILLDSEVVGEGLFFVEMNLGEKRITRKLIVN
jgi:hypothetical protein